MYFVEKFDLEINLKE